jgi:hypothetical protein
MVVFIAEYEDGSTDHFNVDRWTLRSGDYIAAS